MTRCAIYVRESRDDNGASYETIETQKGLLEKFIQDKSLGNLYSIYEDDNYSGVNFERPGIKNLILDASSRKFDILVAKDLSRLGRSNARTLLFLESVEEYGVRVITYDGRYDSLRDAETVGIDSWFNERYVIDISKKIRANLKHKIATGEYIGNAPYGYIKSKEKHNKLVKNEEEALLVKRVYTLYLEGYGYKKIVEIVNGIDLSKKWNASQVKRILTSRVYIGDTIQGVSERVSYKSKKTRRLPKEEWVITLSTHDAIIDKDTFDKVQKERNKRLTGSQNHKSEINVFKGLIYCGKCNKPMYSRKQPKTSGYTCSTYEKYGKQSCIRNFISKDILLEIVFNDLYSVIGDYLERVPDFKKTVLEMNNEDQNKINILYTLIDSTNKKQKCLYYDRLEERVSVDIFDNVYAELVSSLEFYKTELNKLNYALKNKVDGLSVLLKAIKEYKVQGHDIVRKIINATVEKITIDNDNIHIIYKL